jgi:hypothetical protein
MIKKRIVEENLVLLDDASTVCSNDDNMDLEASNLTCSEISEGLGDGGCDPVCLQTLVSQKKRPRPRQKKKIRVILDERCFLELQWVR